VVLDRQVRLLDSPGVVFDDDSALLGNCVDAESMQDPVAAVEAMLKRCTHQSLLLTYSLPNFVPGNADMFLALMAKRQGRVTKGGIPDKVSAARSVLNDWNSGKIPFYTTPPVGEDDDRERQASAVIVSQLGEDFLRKLDEQVLSGLLDDSQGCSDDAMDYLELQPTRVDAKDTVAAFLDDSDEDKVDEDKVDEDGESDSDMDEESSSSEQRLEDAQDYDFDEMV
jgi:nuclear GTP-binding protein